MGKQKKRKTKKEVNLAKFYKGKKVLVTGHTGFKGAWLTEILNHWGAKVSAISLPPHTSPSLYSTLKFEKRISSHFQDIRDYQKIQTIFSKEKPEIVFHLAAQAIVGTSYEDPLLTYSTNVLGTANILQSIRYTKSVKAGVIITSDKAYDNVEWIYPYREIDKLGGRDPYSASKSAADIIAQSFIKSFLNDDKSPFVGITRAGNVIGGGDWAKFRIVPDIIRAFYVDKKPVEIRSPNAIRPWQHVLEPLSGYVLLGKKLYEGDRSLTEAWNFGPNSGNFLTVEEIVKKGIEIVGRGSYEVGSEKFHEATLLKLDISKARSLLGWKPKFDAETTFSYTFEWYKNYYEKKEDPVLFTDRQIDNFFTK
jgi:CDP-glucose 4,6-dehydratase